MSKYFIYLLFLHPQAWCVPYCQTDNPSAEDSGSLKHWSLTQYRPIFRLFALSLSSGLMCSILTDNPDAEDNRSLKHWSWGNSTLTWPITQAAFNTVKFINLIRCYQYSLPVTFTLVVRDGLIEKQEVASFHHISYMKNLKWDTKNWCPTNHKNINEIVCIQPQICSYKRHPKLN